MQLRWWGWCGELWEVSSRRDDLNGIQGFWNVGVATDHIDMVMKLVAAVVEICCQNCGSL